MIEEDLITYETAVLAKSKGFDLETLHFYTKPNSKMFGIDEHGRSYSIKNTAKKLYQCGQHAVLNIKNAFYASSQSLLAKWLRVNHNIHVSPYRLNNQWCCDIFDMTRNCYITSNAFDKNLYDNYEECFEYALQEALKLI